MPRAAALSPVRSPNLQTHFQKTKPKVSNQRCACFVQKSMLRSVNRQHSMTEEISSIILCGL